MKAFREFDEKQIQIEKATKVWPAIIDLDKEEHDKYILQKSKAIKRKSSEDDLQTTNGSNTAICDSTNVDVSTSSTSLSPPTLSFAQKRLAALTLRRSLFSDNFSPKTKFPKKGSYVLGNVYERVFKTPAENLHRAESDVAILTKLILHYGLNFLAYAEERKQLFKNVPDL